MSSAAENVAQSNTTTRLSSSFWVDERQPFSTIKTPLMSTRNDFISFLAVTQYYEIDLISITWQPGRGQIGIGGTAEIRQSTLDPNTSFAFKSYARIYENQKVVLDEYQVYNALILEISILNHPLVRHHQNIVNLEGICWEESLGTTKVWPVLILEKAQFGDLQSFISSEEGRKTSFEEKLGLCTDIGSALATMHRCRITHGDIKPRNVLLFSDKSGAFFAKLADFGYSGWDVTNNKKASIKLPRSRPWDAPEYHHRGFTVTQAIRSDIYSFGMLCMYIMFEDTLYGAATGLQSKNPSMSKTNYEGVFNDFDFTDNLKHGGGLLELAQSLIETVGDSSNGQKQTLSKFFNSALAYDPEQRALKIDELISLLHQDWMPGPVTNDMDQMNIGQTEVKFEISKSFYSLMTGDYRVRKYVISCLEAHTTSNKAECDHNNAAFQLAFAYKTGFGTYPSESLCVYWLQEAGRTPENLNTEIELAGKTINRNAWRNGNLRQLVTRDVLELALPPQRNVTERESELITELEAIERLFGQSNLLVRDRKLELAILLETERRFQEAELIRVEILEDTRILSQQMYSNFHLPNQRKPAIPMPELKLPELALGSDLKKLLEHTEGKVSEASAALRGLALNYWWQSRWHEAEWLFVRIIGIDENFFGKTHPLTLKTCSSLACFYMNRGRLQEAEALISWVWNIQKEVLGIEHKDSRASMDTLVRAISRQGRTKEAAALRSQLLDMCKNILGEADPETFNAMDGMTKELVNQKRWNEAEELILETLRLKRIRLGELHAGTLLSMNGLAAIYHHKGLLKEAEKLLLKVVQAVKSIRSLEYDQALTYTYNLAAVYMSQGLYIKAEKLLTTVVERRKKTIGQEHPETLDSMTTLASVYTAQGRSNEAESLILQVMNVQEQNLGVDHPSCVRAKIQLARSHIEQQRFAESETLIRPLATNTPEIYDHTEHSVDALRILANSVEGQHRWSEAETVYTRVVESLTNLRGPENFLTILALHKRGLMISRQGRYQEADGIFQQVREVGTKLPLEHQWIVGRTIRDQVSNFLSHGRCIDALVHSSTFISWGWSNKAVFGQMILNSLPDLYGIRIPLRWILLPTTLLLGFSGIWRARPRIWLSGRQWSEMNTRT